MVDDTTPQQASKNSTFKGNQNMTDNNIMANTESSETGSADNQASQNQVENAKTFTQDDIDRIVQSRLKQVERKYEGIDIDEYRTLKQAQQEAEKEKMMKREQFEELLQKQRSEYESKLSTLQSELTKTHVDGALLNAAAKHKAVNPEHVANLLRNQVRLGENNQVEVLDSEGNVRYDTEAGKAYSVEDAVAEFLTANPYFRSAQPQGSGSAGNKTHNTSREVSLSDLDMNDPKDRARYKEWRKTQGFV